MPGLRERKKQQTRQHIAETARRLFSDRGFEQVTVAEIAREAQVSEQTVFNYFATKEDLVYWRLGEFEDALLEAIRGRQPGESALAAFRRFILDQRGLLGRTDEGAREELTTLTRMITQSRALLAREQQILAGYTASLARLLAAETGADADDVEPWAAANALMGIHRSLIQYTRRRMLDGARHPHLAREIQAQAEQAFGLLERGLSHYAATPGDAFSPVP
jgi:AcrR family transcriptional regulator